MRRYQTVFLGARQQKGSRDGRSGQGARVGPRARGVVSHSGAQNAQANAIICGTKYFPLFSGSNFCRRGPNNNGNTRCDCFLVSACCPLPAAPPPHYFRFIFFSSRTFHTVEAFPGLSRAVCIMSPPTKRVSSTQKASGKQRVPFDFPSHSLIFHYFKH